MNGRIPERVCIEIWIIYNCNCDSFMVRAFCIRIDSTKESKNGRERTKRAKSSSTATGNRCLSLKKKWINSQQRWRRHDHFDANILLVTFDFYYYWTALQFMIPAEWFLIGNECEASAFDFSNELDRLIAVTVHWIS